jgi:type IV pilus assembly protein PilE
MPAPRSSKGVSLIELITVMAVVSVLSAIAWPSYLGSMQRSRRTEAQLALLQIQFAQERHYATHLRYSSTLSGPATAGGLGMSAHSQNGDYLLSVATVNGGQGYVARAQATPDGRQFLDKPCRQLTLDTTGVRQPQTCWR